MAMAKEENKLDIGRAKIAIVPEIEGEAIAIVTEIFAQTEPVDPNKRIALRGPVKLEDRTRRHLEEVILPIVDRITESLDLPIRNFIISVSNVSASATMGKGLHISGFSADIPLFMALISASLQMALRQGIISTGHIASLAGDVTPVLDIPRKIEAAIYSTDVTEFIYPNIGKDLSPSALIPDELRKAKESLYQHKGRIKLTAIEDIRDAIMASFSEKAIAMAALAQGFFDKKSDSGDANDPVTRSVSFLLEDNEKRFWEGLRDLLFRQEEAKAKSTIRSFIDYHLNQRRYPKNFGEQLHRLAMSLPILVRRLDGLFPLVGIDQCIALSQYAESTDHTDVQTLYKLTSPDEFLRKMDTPERDDASAAGDLSYEGQLIRKILFELSDESLTEKIGKPLDEARANYVMKAVTVKDAFEFNLAITSFYVHMMRYTQLPEGHVSRDAASSEAVDAIRTAFQDRGGYDAALAEAKSAVQGGLRFVFDVMTENEKSVKKGKYKNMILKEAIDAFDWEAKVKLSLHIKKHYGWNLPDAIRTMEPEQIAPRLDEVILLLAAGEKNLDRWFRKH